MDSKSCPKVAPKYYCDICDYNTGKLSSYKKHLSTAKHLRIHLDSKMDSEKVAITFQCNCGNVYKYRQGLVKHKKKCSLFNEKPLENTLTETDITNPSIIMTLIKDNQDFKSLLLEQNKKQEELVNKVVELSREPRIVNTNNTTNTTNNNQFNLNFFLNETCKDAINMVEFVKSIQLHLKDLEETARVGYVEGVSRIFVKALNNMEVNKRPIHCTDIKRETVYVKNNDNWEKDNPEKKNLKNAVDFIANKNMHQINDWKEENPNWQDIKSEESQVLNKMYMTAMGGGTEEEDKKYMNKIIKNILQEVVVEKEQA